MDHDQLQPQLNGVAAKVCAARRNPEQSANIEEVPMQSTADDLRSEIARLRSRLDSTHARIREVKRTHRVRHPRSRATPIWCFGLALAASLLIAAAQKTGASSGAVAQAPFVVVDDDDNPILIVKGEGASKTAANFSEPLTSRGAFLCDKAGNPVAALYDLKGRGLVRVLNSGDGGTGVAMGPTGVEVRKEGHVIVSMGQSATGGVINVFGGRKSGRIGAIEADNPVAQISALKDGTGRIGVYDRGTGDVLAYLGETGAGGGAVVVLDPKSVRAFWAYGTEGGARACVNHKLREFCLKQGL
jgi:hypothetical protein